MTDQQPDLENLSKEKEFSQQDMGLVATIFGAMSRDAAWTQNQLEGSYQKEIEEWKAAFLALYRDVKEANLHARNMDVADALHFASHRLRDAQRPGWWVRENQ